MVFPILDASYIGQPFETQTHKMIGATQTQSLFASGRLSRHLGQPAEGENLGFDAAGDEATGEVAGGGTKRWWGIWSS